MAQISTNVKLVERRARIGKYLTTAALLIIMAPLFFSLPTLFSGRNELPADQLLLLYGALIIGLILSNIGGSYLNRWGSKAYEQLGASLKGLDKRYHLFNFLLPVPHVLLTPYGVTVLLVKNLDGQVYANQRGWRQSVSLLRLLRWFSTERVGDPIKDLEAQQELMRSFVREHLGGNFQVPIDGWVVFTNPQVNVQIENIEPPVVVLAQDPDALKNALKRDKRAAPLSKQQYDELHSLFTDEAEAERADAERGFVVFGRKVF